MSMTRDELEQKILKFSQKEGYCWKCHKFISDQTLIGILCLDCNRKIDELAEKNPDLKSLELIYKLLKVRFVFR
jgi:Zn finger protein HypA/HybF involved in hydrogenase expression